MRCDWVDETDEMYIAYHDTEWGVPVHDDRQLFENLILEIFSSGLSWQCVLHKRPFFRSAFDNFNPQKVATYTDTKISELLSDSHLIRHLGKIKATITNAAVFLKIQQEFGSFDTYLSHWTKGQINHSDGHETRSPLSDHISQDLKARGMTYIGTTTIFAYLCAIGLISAHTPACFKYRKP